jgi:hypothetical protein
MQFTFRVPLGARSRSRRLEEFLSQSLFGCNFPRIQFIGLKLEYEKTYPVNPGDRGVRSASVVLRDQQRNSHRDGSSGHAQADKHHYGRATSKLRRRLLADIVAAAVSATKADRKMLRAHARL